MRLVMKRLGGALMKRRRAPLARFEGMGVLEALGAVVLDCVDGEARPAILVRRGN